MLSEGRTRTDNSQSRVSEGWTGRCREAAGSTVDDYPLSTTLGMFAVGLSLGVMVGAALARPLHLDQRRTAESLGRRMLETLHEHFPDSVSKYLRS